MAHVSARSANVLSAPIFVASVEECNDGSIIRRQQQRPCRRMNRARVGLVRAAPPVCTDFGQRGFGPSLMGAHPPPPCVYCPVPKR